MKIGLITVSTSSYIKGTKALFNSFLKTNSWFKGDLICIDVNLTIKNKKQLNNFSPIYLKPFSEFLQKLNSLLSISEYNRTRLHAVEAFRIAKNYDKLLFLDSDMLVVKEIKEIFEIDYNAACVDSCVLKNQRRDKTTYLPQPFSGQPNERLMDVTINTGFMLLQNSASLYYHKLIDAIGSSTFLRVEENLGDETLINQVLLNCFKVVPSIYNYRIHLEREQFLLEKIKYSDAKIFHYTGVNKPWLMQAYFNLITRNLRYIKFLWLWNYYSR
jgi:lipopolysaccharide biosynthesis glycosyltransferase